MQGIENIGFGKLKGNHAHNSKRPGNPGHPGKHLGQFKQAMMANINKNTSIPLVQQQLSDIKNNTSIIKEPQSNQVNDINTQIALNALRSTQESISDSLQFTSRFNAISTAFF